MKQTAFLKINPADSVVVCLRPMQKGETINIDGKTIEVKQDTPAGHKLLIKDAPKGTDIIKYGYPIGHTIEDLTEGQWVNENNIKTNLSGSLEYTYSPVDEKLSIENENLTFKGYMRKNGEVGIRNEIWIVPTVGCVNGIAEKLVEMLKAETGCEGIDAIHAWHHNYGCSQLSGDHENTRKVLRDIVLHPNAGAVLILSLGCENNQPDEFIKLLGDYDKDRIKLLVTQKVEGDELEEGMKILRNLYNVAKQDVRTEVPISHLRVGLKCGGSDGFSGITANPLVGEFSDWLVAQGGTSILTEVPEMFGAETILMNRCENSQLFEQTVTMINDFKEYFLSHGEPVGENPSPGNKAGGISTLEDKALGCTQKCGRAPVSGVLAYGDRLQVNGLNLLSAPGNDLVAATALASSGCQIVLFTTG
ncbi:MAG: altronate dehydratase, partial [Prevotella sp.]|nr:altronate dehydratase [Prevotella sp.]